MLSNTATPLYYGQFRDAVMRGEIPVCKEISMEMNRIDALIANPGVYYDNLAVNGFIAFCESELTLTDGSVVAMGNAIKVFGEPGKTLLCVTPTFGMYKVYVRLMSIESMMLSNHFILCQLSSPHVLNLSQHQDLFQ